jgi:hypothetical protein
MKARWISPRRTCYTAEGNTETHHTTQIDSDDVVKLDVLREAARMHNDTFVVEADLEDQDQREASPGTRDQE